MSGESISKGRQLYHVILGWTIIVAVLAAVAWFVWAKQHYDPERRLAGRWVFDETAAWNAGQPGGYQLEFSDRTVRVFDPAGSQIYSQPWASHKFGSTEGEFPIVLSFKKLPDDFYSFASVALSRDETRMRFRIDGDGPSRANEFRRAR